jgi:hypothetical protein
MTDEEKRELRNSVFAAKQAAENAAGGEVQPISSQQYAKQELGLDIPVDAVPLPSGGRIYPEGHALHNKDRVEFRAMTAREEDILMSRAYIKKGTVITELIKSCLLDKSIYVNDMISGDRNALMVAIRVSGYGREYNPVFNCPQCSVQNELQVDLAALDIKPLKLESAGNTNLFYFDLPMTKKRVGFKFLTGEEEEKILQALEMKKKKGIQNENLITTRLLSSIVEINGVTDRGQIAKFVQFMPARDSLALRQYIDENEPGVDMTVEFMCKNCDHVADIALPMGPTFFWPNART